MDALFGIDGDGAAEEVSVGGEESEGFGAWEGGEFVLHTLGAEVDAGTVGNGTERVIVGGEQGIDFLNWRRRLADGDGLVANVGFVEPLHGIAAGGTGGVDVEFEHGVGRKNGGR